MVKSNMGVIFNVHLKYNRNEDRFEILGKEF